LCKKQLYKRVILETSQTRVADTYRRSYREWR